MRKLRIGIWINSNIKPEAGGGYDYYNELLKALNNYSFKNAEIIFLSNKKITVDNFKIEVIDELKDKSLFFKIIKKISPLFKNIRKVEDKIKNKQKDKLKKTIYKYADIIYYLTPGCVYPDFPYIYTLWDLGHLNSYAFPEFSMNGNFEGRKKHCDLFLQKALTIFTESETGKKECKKYLNINEKRIKIVPIFPSGIVNPKCISIKPEKIKDGEFFIHYPAQYWTHKNHYNLLSAMILIIKDFPKIKLILTGSDKGNKNYILETIKKNGLKNNIIDLGFVPKEELKWLYENSQGLVMPTLLGPTNIPLLDASKLGCPVACTNLPGHIEQLGNYGYYFNGTDPKDISIQVIKMINDKKNNVKREYNNKFNIKNTLNYLDKAFTEIKQIRFCWGENDKIF